MQGCLSMALVFQVYYPADFVANNRNKRVLDYRVESRLTMDGARDFKVGEGINRWS